MSGLTIRCKLLCRVPAMQHSSYLRIRGCGEPAERLAIVPRRFNSSEYLCNSVSERGNLFHIFAVLQQMSSRGALSD